jgi:GYF domain 2
MADVAQRLSSNSGVHIREGVVSALNDPVWYISRDDDRRGPFSSDQFARFEEAGALRPTDQVWQTGMDAWIDYNDYVARKSVGRSESPHRPTASGPEENEPFVRRGMRALTTTLKTTFHRVSTLLAKIPGARPSLPAADSVHLPEGTARPPVYPHPASIPPSLPGTLESGSRPFANGPILRHPASSVRGHHHTKQDQDSAMPEAKTEDPIQALPHSPSSIPRLASEGQAAAQIGLDLATFRAWVAAGRLPYALPGCGKYDMKAIHLALDRISGIVSRENG